MRKGIRNSHKFLLLIFETIAISQPEVKLR